MTARKPAAKKKPVTRKKTAAKKKAAPSRVYGTQKQPLTKKKLESSRKSMTENRKLRRPDEHSHSLIQPGLTDTELAFCEHLLNDPRRVKTEAYLKACGYRCTRKSASILSNRIYHRPEVQAYLIRRMTQIFRKLKVNADRVFAEVCHAVFLDPAQVFDKNGKYLPLHKIPAHVRRCIKSINVTQEGKIQKIHWEDKTRSREQLMRYFNMFAEENAGKWGMVGDALSEILLKVQESSIGPENPEAAAQAGDGEDRLH